MNFEIIKKNYDSKLWNISHVKIAVHKGLITKEEYKKITGEKF